MSQSTTTRRSPELTVGQSAPDGSRGADMAVELHVFLAALLAVPQCVAGIRRTAGTFLRRAGLPESLVDDAVLAVSELVTNAIQHGGGEIGLRVSVVEDEVLISVTDESPERAELKHAALGDISGRGLLLVEAVAHSWGSSGEQTWCILRPPLGAPGAVGA
ncbi:ATP-binding protein [Streptomyces sp. NPDC094461]|uniref:ATP-binding protein n=1 Tax=unclassified Streptomyces TaxID=2593676 RepID=UPI0037F7F497